MGNRAPALVRRLGVSLAVPVLAYALYSTAQQAIESRRMAQQVAELQRTVDGLQAKNIRLQNELTYRRGDVYVEQVAREQLGLVMPGDTAVNLLGENVPRHSKTPGEFEETTAVPSSTPGAPRKAPLEAWLSYFLGG